MKLAWKNNDYRLFCSLVKSSQNALLKGLAQMVEKIYPEEKISKTKEYIYARGELPVMLIAHCDTVFKQLPQKIFYDREQCVLWSPQGLGADDRAGVYAILKIIQKGYRPSILFTTDEEIGGLGASAFVRDYPAADIEYKYLIQLDRSGECDCVFYDCDNVDFVDYCESFGFTEDFGSFSDISVICPVWKIAGVNLSVGYYDEHSKQEILFTNILDKTISKVEKMLSFSKESKTFEYIPGPYSYYGRYAYGWGILDPEDQLNLAQTYKEDYSCVCNHCGNTYRMSDCIPVRKRGMKNSWGYYCYNCLDDESIDWCNCCGEAFEKEYPTQKLCEACGGLLTNELTTEYPGNTIAL